MIMKVEPIDRALASLGVGERAGRQAGTRVVLTSPQGRRFTQALAIEYAALDHVALVCGRYKGVDERVSERLVDEELSVGDFVLSGGEPAALCVVDAVARLRRASRNVDSVRANRSLRTARRPYLHPPGRLSRWTSRGPAVGGSRAIAGHRRESRPAPRAAPRSSSRGGSLVRRPPLPAHARAARRRRQETGPEPAFATARPAAPGRRRPRSSAAARGAAGAGRARGRGRRGVRLFSCSCRGRRADAIGGGAVRRLTILRDDGPGRAGQTRSTCRRSGCWRS